MDYRVVIADETFARQPVSSGGGKWTHAAALAFVRQMLAGRTPGVVAAIERRKSLTSITQRIKIGSRQWVCHEQYEVNARGEVVRAQ